MSQTSWYSPFHSALPSPVESPRGWKIPTANPVLTAGQAHVWQADLDTAATQLHRWECLLAPEEKAWAAGLRFADARERFVTARGVLRELLACYAKMPPSQLRFGYGVQGKPFLQEPGTNRLFFNVSHSGGKALFVFATGDEVGVDIERIRERVDARVIATALSPFERRALCTLGEISADVAFFEFWTRKEAYLKADGLGIGRTLQHLDVSPIEATGSWSRVRVWHQEIQVWRQDAHWNLRTLEIDSAYAAAIATKNQIRQLCCWLWDTSLCESNHKPSAPLNRAQMPFSSG